jgi:two-component system response regulator RegA
MSPEPTARDGALWVVDDDPTFNRVLARALERRGFAVQGIASAAEAEARLAGPEEEAPAYAVVDLNLAGDSGLRLIRALLAKNFRCRIVILTGYASIATAVDAIKLGAVQYFAKPTEVDVLARALRGEDSPELSALPTRPLSVSRLEWEHIQRLLTEHGGNISATARALRMHRRTLQRKLAKRPQD